MKPTIGLFGIGLDTYWPQFPGLREQLVGYQAVVRRRLEEAGANVVDVGLVDSPERAHAAAADIVRADVDLVVLYVSTYALSSTVLPLVQRVRRPVLVLGLQPTAAMDYAAINAMGDRGAMTGAWLAHCQACSLPEIGNVFNRARIRFDSVSGSLDDESAWREIGGWLTAAKVVKTMANNRVGVLGHYYCGMLDVYSDLTQQAAVLGCHFELLEIDELAELRRNADAKAVAAAKKRLSDAFAIDPSCTSAEVERAARTTAALLALAERHRLGSLAYYHEGRPGDENQDIVTSLIPGLTLLTANGVPTAGECEVKNAQAMKIFDAIGAGGSFAEFYGLDLNDDIVLLGHDGPGHPTIAAERVRLVPLPIYHGKPGCGLSIQMRVRLGPVTVLSLAQDGDGRVSLVWAEGEAVDGPTLEIGNTNSRYRFALPAARFVDAWASAGPAHHCAIAVGHHGHWLAKLARLWGITGHDVIANAGAVAPQAGVRRAAHSFHAKGAPQ